VIIFTSPKRGVVSAHRGDAAGSGDGRWAERRSLNNAFGEALAYAFEFAVTPVLFAGLGWLLDQWAGTGPLLMVALAGFGFVGVSLRTVYRYKEKVELDEEGKPWTRRPR
jgi:F0F1-type ATP synthase assembly protein I